MQFVYCGVSYILATLVSVVVTICGAVNIHPLGGIRNSKLKSRDPHHRVSC